MTVYHWIYGMRGTLTASLTAFANATGPLRLLSIAIGGQKIKMQIPHKKILFFSTCRYGLLEWNQTECLSNRCDKTWIWDSVITFYYYAFASLPFQNILSSYFFFYSGFERMHLCCVWPEKCVHHLLCANTTMNISRAPSPTTSLTAFDWWKTVRTNLTVLLTNCCSWDIQFRLNSYLFLFLENSVMRSPKRK